MPTNEYLPFAAGVGANVIDQVSWAALAGRTTGFVAGTALSAHANKPWRQSTVVAATFAQYIVDKANVDTLDDGNTTALLASFKKAVGLDIQDGQETFATAAGTNALTAVLTPAPLALVDGMRIVIRPTANNTAAATIDFGGAVAGARAIVRANGLPLVQGDLTAGAFGVLFYDASLNRWQLSNPAAGEPRTFIKRFIDDTPGTRNFTALVTGWHKLTLSGAGGGGGAGLTTGAGGGGGGGGKNQDYVFLIGGVAYSYTIGTGGTGAVAGTSNNGVSGTSSSFTGIGGTVVATGGTFGTGSIAGGSGAGGPGGGGSGQSANGKVTTAYSGLQGQNVGTPRGGGGGNSGDGGQGGPESNGNGNPGGAPGGGGGGSTASGFAGAGAAGRFEMEW